MPTVDDLDPDLEPELRRSVKKDLEDDLLEAEVLAGAMPLIRAIDAETKSEDPDRITNDFPAIFKLADMLCRQAKSFLPKGVRTPGKVVATILAGRELNIGTMEALRSLHIVNGKVQMESRLMLALALRGGVRHKWMRRDSTRVELKLWRPGFDNEGETFAWTAEDTKQAGLAGKDVWKKYTRKMMCWRVTSEAIDLYCPDVLLGVYAPGELIGLGGIDITEYGTPAAKLGGADLDDDSDDDLDGDDDNVIDVEADDNDTLD